MQNKKAINGQVQRYNKCKRRRSVKTNLLYERFVSLVIKCANVLILLNKTWKLKTWTWKVPISIYVVDIIFCTCGQDPPCASDFILHILLLRTGSSPKPASCKTYVAKIIHPLLCQITGCNTLTSSKCFKIAYFFRKIVLQWEMEDSVSFVKAFDRWKFCLQVS